MPKQFTSSIVVVLTKGGTIVGNGFLVSEKYILTCAHVVTQALGIPVQTPKSPINPVALKFPWIAERKNISQTAITGHVIFWLPVTTPPKPESDIAILELDFDPPEGSRPGQLFAEDDLWGHSFKAFGFPGMGDNCALAKGVIRDELPNGRVVLEDINNIGFWISPGFSGSPIWDNETNGIVGMVDLAEKCSDIRTAYMIPTTTLVKICPILDLYTKWIKTGFLKKIGYPNNKWYGKIDQLYVSPLDYDAIKEALKEKRIVFITGTQEYGKTYTAVRLLWEYYKNGYEPKWIKGGEIGERRKVRLRLDNIKDELKPGRINYFEDPFGKIKYEKREGLEREIGTIIDNVMQVDNVYVIITSREEVFKEFEKEKVSETMLNEFEQKLNIKKPSYDYGKRKEILLKLAEEENCKWLSNKKLKEFVIKSIKDEKILPTILSIKDFALTSSGIGEELELKEKLKEKSKETAKAFAKEIKEMRKDKLLFVSLLFTSFCYSDIESMRNLYQELLEEVVKEFNLEEAWEFDRVLNWFKNDKVNIKSDMVEFSHPSYYEALEYLLIEDGYITEINKKIFSKLVLWFSLLLKGSKFFGENKFEADEDIDFFGFLYQNFNKMPRGVWDEILFTIYDYNLCTFTDLAIYNFDKLHNNVKALFLNTFMEDKAYWEEHYSVSDVLETLIDNFNKFNKEEIKKLLTIIENLNEYDVFEALANKIDKLPANVRNELFHRFTEKRIAVDCIASWIIKEYHNLSENLRNLLFEIIRV